MDVLLDMRSDICMIYWIPYFHNIRISPIFKGSRRKWTVFAENDIKKTESKIPLREDFLCRHRTPTKKIYISSLGMIIEKQNS